MTGFFNWGFWTHWIGLWGVLTIVFLALALVVSVFAAVYVKRLGYRTPLPISEEIGSVKAVMHKVSKREPMSKEELDYAKQIVADRRSLMALCIPGTLFALACFFVFGSLWYLHGATPSERTFLGLIPMLTSTNLAVRLRARARLKRRLDKMSVVPSPS
jgi:Kef-type K+ transport system membrane component KefB